MTKRFTAKQFTPTQWDTAEDKAQFANQFVKFVEGGFQQKDFPRWFYDRLSKTFGHIAQYNYGGFWDYWFETQSTIVRFIEYTLDWHPVGDPKFTYCDVERAIIAWLKDSGIPERVREELEAEVKRREIALRDELLKKHPL